MRLSFIILLGSISIGSMAQNLVLNPSFKPQKDSRSEAQLYLAPGYSNPNQGTTDLYSRTASKYQVGIPQNFTGWQEINGSDYYAGIIAYYADQKYDGTQPENSALAYGKYSEYLQVALKEPLIAGHKYTVSFDASLAESSAYASTLGVFITTGQVNDAGNQTLGFTPQIESKGLITDMVMWTKVNGTYTANGGERFLIIGRYNSTVKSLVEKNQKNNLRAYYYLSNVIVEDLNGTVTSEPKKDEATPEAAKSNDSFRWPVLNFETNRNAIEIDGYKDLNALAEWMKGNPSAKIKLEGHTDKVGNVEYNQALSVSRAQAARKYLISKGIESNRMDIAGVGMNNLAEPNGPADNLKNRRVVISLK